ncbi:MAG: malonyl-ACP O-methyltransferase BioC [Candidatus Omnitrophota bacterium]
MKDKRVIKNNFSRSAKFYDQYATVQNLCADELISRVEDNQTSQILELGCGTGNFTKLLYNKFPQARITAVDISREMVEIAKRRFGNNQVKFVIADAEQKDFIRGFDLICSNASLQWFVNVERTLARYKASLKKNGIFLFSIFGPQTYGELDSCLKELFAKDIRVEAGDFFTQAGLKEILTGLFFKTTIVRKIYKERYKTLWELLQKIKYTGTRGNGVYARKFWTGAMIKKLEQVYLKKYKQIIATFEVFFCAGVK